VDSKNNAVLNIHRDKFEDFIGDNPFAVLLGDTIFSGDPNCTKGLVSMFEERKASVFSVELIKAEQTKRYGVVGGEIVDNGVMQVSNLVEKPEPEEAPSLFGIQGRYVFTSDIFAHLKKTEIGANGEIQLTDAMQSFIKDNLMFSWTFEGRRYDIGTIEDWFKSHFELSHLMGFSYIFDEVIKKV